MINHFDTLHMYYIMWEMFIHLNIKNIEIKEAGVLAGKNIPDTLLRLSAIKRIGDNNYSLKII